MKRDYRFDIVRVVCMTYIVAIWHLYPYIHTGGFGNNIIFPFQVVCDACLGLFTFTSGYLIGKKYRFGTSKLQIKYFYKKRLVRIIPLFFLSSIALYLIGLNDLRQTTTCVLCISPFVVPTPFTLWYIPVILYMYLATPFLSRNKTKKTIVSCFIFILILIVLFLLLPHFDFRLLFNAFFYCAGLCCASFGELKVEGMKAITIKMLCTFFASILILSIIYPINKYSLRVICASLGVIAIFVVCGEIDRFLFCNSYKLTMGGGRKFIDFLSYASMSVYMFHRLFFWLGEQIWNPQIIWIKWCYMELVIFSLTCVACFYIQKGYDYLISLKV